AHRGRRQPPAAAQNVGCPGAGSGTGAQRLDVPVGGPFLHVAAEVEYAKDACAVWVGANLGGARRAALARVVADEGHGRGTRAAAAPRKRDGVRAARCIFPFALVREALALETAIGVCVAPANARDGGLVVAGIERADRAGPGGARACPGVDASAVRADGHLGS